MPDFTAPDRRRFLRLAAGFALAGAASSAAVAQEAEVADPRLTVETVTFQVRRQVYKGRLLRLRTGGRRPGVLVLPDQRGPDGFFRGHAKRLALDGFVVMLPDLLSPQGISPDQTEEARNALSRLSPVEAMQAFEAAADLLMRHAECTGSIAAVGFSWSGAFALQFAIAGNRVKAVVAYYPQLPSLDRMAEIKTPVLFHWSENDPRTAPLVDGLEKRLIGAGRPFEAFVYPDTQNGFASEPETRRWVAAAADRAYERSAFFLRRQLVGGV
ncbi:MAG: dienelactone hydrolase family protein [Hyphomicrobiales bacterium]|nr:dienelactone hydrolase family protein [Hyphomicrobiales bacterium]